LAATAFGGTVCAMASRTTTASRIRPLLVTDDAALLDDVLRIAASAGAEVEVAPDLTAARAHYGTAPFVLIGLELAETLAGAPLPRRPRVVLLGADGDTPPPWRLAERIGAEHIALLPAAEPWLVDRFADSLGPRPAGRLVAVLGGRGGAGASVFAAGLAVTAARVGLRVLLVDADPLGGGLDLILGWEAIDGLRWPDLSETGGSVSPPALVDALPRRGDLAVLSWDRASKPAIALDAMTAAIDAGRLGRDLVVVDLPRHIDEASAAALNAADRALLVVPAELRACAAASRIAAVAGGYTQSLAVVVRGPAPGRLKAREIARALDLPLCGWLRPEPDLARALERGEPPAGTGTGPLAALCRRLLAELELVPGTVAVA
jgi:secretion/DNA translocation related CpaE-like protein